MPNIIPQEALNYLGNKKLTVGFDHGDVWKAEHNSSFTVAKMMKLDLLADTREALEQALREGKTFKQFAEQLKPQLIKKGWWGQQTAIDPLDDSEKLVQLGSNARLKTIYQTNMRTARGAGQWERIERNKETHPYLLYELGPSREHREDHVKWNNLLLPIDDPFWQTHYTPNGWGCKCRVRSVSENEATQLTQTGINKKQQELDDNGLPTGRFTSETSAVKLTSPTIKTRQFVNKRTGEVEQVPEGIDPGWNYHPGTRLAKLANNAMAKGIDAEPMTASIAITDLMKVEAISGEVGKVFAQGVDDAVKQIAAGKAIPRGTTWHLGAIQPEVVSSTKK